jgi:16S rRNA (guanine1207-N2)-methyltransferase
MFIRSDIPKLKQNLKINSNLLGFDLEFQTKWGVFSPKAIDEGTLLLLKYLEIDENDKCLDLGCGYGPIGLSVAKTAKSVEMVDKDFVAIELSNLNAQINKLPNAKAYLSDGFSNVESDKFTQIISNVPAKVGREQLSIMLYDAFDKMEAGGKITFVTINGLRDFIKTNFKSVFGNYKKLKQGAKYTISQAIKE